MQADTSPPAASVRHVCLLWFGAWSIGQVVATAIAAASGHTSHADDGPGWRAAVAVAGWVPLLAALYSARHSWQFRVRPIDIVGVPIGVATQLVLVPLVYWPLRAIWPTTFSEDALQQRAKDLYDHAHGAGLVLLVAIVVIGAPLVEEMVYRGLLQGAFTRRFGNASGLVIVALWFAVIHFQPVETPGLFVVGLVLGGCAVATRRLGLGVVAHMAFNATGLVLVARS